MRTAIALLCATATITLTACGSDTAKGVTQPPPTQSGAGTLELIPSSAGVLTSMGDTRSAVAVVRDANNVIVAPPAITWTSSSPNVATVTGTGAVGAITAVGDGTTTITASTGTVQNTLTVTVHRVIAGVLLTAPSPTLVLGSSMQLKATAVDARQNALPQVNAFTYSTDNTNATDVSTTGVLTALFQFQETLTAKVTATVIRDGVTISGSLPVTITIPTGFNFAALMLTDFEKPNAINAPGAGLALFARDGGTVKYTVTWSALTGPAGAVHIHGPASGEDIVDILVELPIPVQNHTFGTLTGSFTAANIRPINGAPAISLDSLMTLVHAQKAYVDVHTAAHPGGEIRGQFTPPS